MTETTCEYCGFEYSGRASSEVIYHLCADEEYHLKNRLDLTEIPLQDLTEDIPDEKFRIGVNYNHNLIK